MAATWDQQGLKRNLGSKSNNRVSKNTFKLAAAFTSNVARAKYCLNVSNDGKYTYQTKSIQITHGDPYKIRSHVKYNYRF